MESDLSFCNLVNKSSLAHYTRVYSVIVRDLGETKSKWRHLSGERSKHRTYHQIWTPLDLDIEMGEIFSIKCDQNNLIWGIFVDNWSFSHLKPGMSAMTSISRSVITDYNQTTLSIFRLGSSDFPSSLMDEFELMSATLIWNLICDGDLLDFKWLSAFCHLVNVFSFTPLSLLQTSRLQWSSIVSCKTSLWQYSRCQTVSPL